ncbi:DUF3152 domain-containing protein [Corynebacterium sp. UBA2622]|uniref:DUF3152 domain-containing protein n=1 Tax=Corynebacterium sp. UBA2622 TaxID=1946393 RepID=UPI0025BA563D|nr:DUF3152 domain-containing protein [Corynebacterium sp. UBA2622]
MTRHHATPPEQRKPEGRDSFFVRFAREYGWRAYAIPVLAVITALVLANMVQNPGESAVADSGPASSTTATPATRTPADLPEGALNPNDLPPGGAYTEQGRGTYHEVGKPGAKAGSGEEQVVRYVVEIEDGVDAASYGGDDGFASLIDATFADPRGWTNDPRFRFERVTGADKPDLRIQLTSVGTTRERCGADLGLEVSCRTTITGESTVVVNESRWVRGAAPFEGDLGRYRQYLINHEVGHALGFAAHEACPANGELAPVMMQQTLSLSNAELHALDSSEVYPDTGETCLANPWPYPRPAVL